MGEIRYTLRQLQYFLAVAETGTITGAAQRCYVSQTAVSLGLADLERALGVQLILRQRAKGVILTASGQLMLTEARSLFGQAEEFQNEADIGSVAVSGMLNIGCYTAISPIVMPQLLEDVARLHPALTVSLDEGSQPELEEALASARIDVAIMYDQGPCPTLDKVVLGHAYPYVILAPEHPMAAQESVSLAELAAEPMILFDVSPSREDWGAMIDELQLEPIVALRAKSFELTRCLVGRDFGYAVLIQRPHTVHTYDSSTVVVKPIRERVRARTVVAAYPAGMRLTAKAEAFVDLCRTVVPACLEVG